ncbi:MAG: polyprenyl synthetase family protein [Ethanoligenens sp.]
MEYGEQIERITKRVDEALDHYLPKEEGPQKRLFQAMRYSVMAGGKRIRPMLTLEFCRLCGGTEEQALPFACAVEMIHTYSLIHDDLPCMDDDDLRRGRPSCHIQFDYATALLAGDALLSLAFETGLCNNMQSGVMPQNALRAFGLLAEASGGHGMVGGQMIDLLSEGKEIPLELLETMHRSKTGAMIRAAAVGGCILAGADESHIHAATAYAEKLGLAFQIMDDVLDVTGDSATLGKPAGSDLEKHTSTYVTHLGLETARQLARKLSGEAVECLCIFGEERTFLADFAMSLSRRDH